MDAPCRIRTAEPSDLPAIARIEREVFSDPWTPEALRGALSPLVFVAESEREVIGYLYACAAADEAEILNLAVAAPYRRRGVGGNLARHALATLARRGVRRVFLEVRASNQVAQRFYAQLGFRVVGRRRGYYRRPKEDALVLSCCISATL